MTLTNYAQIQLIGQIDPGVTFSPPTTWYMALYVSNSDPNLVTDELTVDGYAREPFAFTLVSPGNLSNVADIAWTGLGATDIGGFAIWDDATAGNEWFFWNEVPASYAIGSNILISAGNLVMTI